RKVKAGDKCHRCGGDLALHNGLELGHIFKLGTKYSAKLGATFLDAQGVEKPIIMGSYGIGLERIMACACEQKGDDHGAVWPISIAPSEVYILILNPFDKSIEKAADGTIKALTEEGFSAIIDDRDISAGIKFNDADLLGIPLRVTIGPKGLKEDRFDIFIRESRETVQVARHDIVGKCKELKAMLYRRIDV
ncbi:hypothetical protein AMJ87_02795, partial [candidate division WOR_3 bacterium SM23_60]